MSGDREVSDWVACGDRGAETLARALEDVSRWAQGYLRSLETRDVSDRSSFGDVLDRIGGSPPEEGLGVDALASMIGDVDRDFVSALTHWQSPRFFSYFPCSNSTPAIVGELMSAVFNVNGMLWSTSPACTELEMRMMDWSAELLGIDDAFTFDRSERGGGCIQATASEAALAALCAARRRCTRRGVSRNDVCVYASAQAHSSIVKAAMIAGLADHAEDTSRVRLIATDERLRMDPAALKAAIDRDIAQGLAPMMVVATCGTTATGAFDPIGDIAGVLEGYGDGRAWLHIDAAWAGAACVVPEHRGILRGHELADSLCINPHKWLLTNFDCDLFWVRDRDALTDSMSITPAYLRDGSDGVVNYRDWHVPLGRRMRALKLWFVYRCFGAQGLREHIGRHIGLALDVERWVVEHEMLELLCDRSLGLVCFGVAGADERTRRVVDGVNARGVVSLTRTEVEIGGAPRCVARVSVGTPGADAAAVAALKDELNAALSSA